MNFRVPKSPSVGTENINNGNVREVVIGFCIMPLFLLSGCYQIERLDNFSLVKEKHVQI